VNYDFVPERQRNLIGKMFKGWAWAYFIFGQGQGYLGPLNFILLITSVVLTGGVSKIITGLGISTTLALVVLLPLAVLGIFVIGLFQYRFIYEHQMTASIDRSRETKQCFEQVDRMEPMMKDLVAKIDALQREVKQLREERNEKV
jgi:hypothetical protein